MVQTPVKPVTLETFLAMPATKPASEFINGKILQKPMPQGEHSVLQGELGGDLEGNQGVRQNPRCGYWRYWPAKS